MEALFQGIVFGFLVALMLGGPVFFALMQTSITRGFSAGAFMALGILLSDAFCVFVSYFGLVGLFHDPIFMKYLGLVGSAFMALYGLSMILKKRIEVKPADDSKFRKGGPLLKGFLLNTLNPFAITYWLGNVSWVNSVFSPSEVPLFFGGALSVVFGTDLAKAYVAKRLQRVLNAKVLLRINHFSGAVLVIGGCVILYKVLSGQSLMP